MDAILCQKRIDALNRQERRERFSLANDGGGNKHVMARGYRGSTNVKSDSSQPFLCQNSNGLL